MHISRFLNPGLYSKYLSRCCVVVLLCCRMYIPDLPTYLVFYLETTCGSSIDLPTTMTTDDNTLKSLDMPGYLIFYWMLLLLLSEVTNTTIFLMALLNAVDGKNRWSSYMATWLSLLPAIYKRPIRLAVMAWHHWRDLASRIFGNALVEDKTIGWYCQISGQHQLGFSFCCSLGTIIYYQSTIHLINKIK